METCHCGQPIHYYQEMDNFTRNLCLECSTVRCDIEWPCPVIGDSAYRTRPYEKTLDQNERTGN